jgi:hypothetical protein
LGLTQANLDELEQALREFNASKNEPRLATTERATQTETLPGLIRDASVMLRQEIDRLVNLFGRSHPNFVTGYRAARVIIDRTATHA